MRSWLYTPANNPSRMINAGIYGADGVVFDLEDSIAPQQKDEARLLLEEMLPVIREDLERLAICCLPAVRINGMDTPWWREDVECCLKAGSTIIRVPKVEQAEDVRLLSAELYRLEEQLGVEEGTVGLQLILETPLGVENAFAIAAASKRTRALSFGSEDYCASLGLKRKNATLALDYPRSRIASAAAAYLLEAYDSVWGFVDDEQGLIEDAKRARALGFTGKSVIHPNQIEKVNELFSYSEEEISEAGKILQATENSETGVLAENGRMVDVPVVNWARRVVST